MTGSWRDVFGRMARDTLADPSLPPGARAVWGGVLEDTLGVPPEPDLSPAALERLRTEDRREFKRVVAGLYLDAARAHADSPGVPIGDLAEVRVLTAAGMSVAVELLDRMAPE